MTSAGEPASDHHVGAVVQGAQQRGNLRRVVLPIRISLHSPVVSAVGGEAKSRPQCTADSDVEGKVQDVDSSGPSQLPGPVGGAVVDYEHVVLGHPLGQFPQYVR